MSLPKRMLPLLLGCAVSGFAQPASPGRLDFLKAHDSSFALLANTSATFQAGKHYPNELFLITGLPSAPAISARVDFGLGDPHCPSGEPCGRLRNMAISPDGDTALVTTDASDAQTLAGRDVSVLILLRHVRAFARSRNAADLGIRLFRGTDFPQLDNVSGVAFGPDGRWAVVSTAGAGVIDLTYTKIRGTLVVITGLPDNPQFSQPFPVPMHSQGNISLSLDGGTLLLNDTVDLSTGTLTSNQIIVQGVQPGSGPPRVIAASSFPLPDGVTNVLQPVRDAKLTLDGRFALAPICLIRSFDPNGLPVGYNQIEILGPVRRGRLDERVLTEADGVTGGPFYAAISPDGNSALVVNDLDQGGGALLTGLASGEPARFVLKPLPFPFFGPPFPLGPNGPPVLAPHGPVVFTADGKTALVENWVIPPLADSPLVPSITTLTGFDTGMIQVAAHLMDPTLNAFDINQQLAAVPSGLLDYVNLYVPPGADRDNLTSLVNQAVAASDRDDAPGPAVELLVRFMRAANDLRRSGALTAAQVTTLHTLATAGAQAVTGPVMNRSSAGSIPGAVSAESIASLRGEALGGSQQELTILDSKGMERRASLFQPSQGGIDYLVPRETAAGSAVAIVSSSGAVVAAALLDIEAVSPGLFTLDDGSAAAAAVQRVKPDGSQTYEPVAGPIDLGADTDEVVLVLFGTGIRGGTGPRPVSARIGDQEAVVLFAGPQGGFDGLDQVNLRIPRSVIGAGKVEIDVTVDGWEANKVTVNIR
jgi:uncharacterized protein (TIGR03437 family)